MTRLTAFGIALAPIALFAAAPAAAQDDLVGPPDADDVKMAMVYGDDKCPEQIGDEILICVVFDESERYRIPPNLRESSNPANQAWTERVKSLQTVGNFGIMSCSPSGYGGWSGCTQQLIDAAYAEKRGGQNVRAAQLIEEARAERLSEIDAAAAEEQARVEALEREYEARLEAERAQRAPGEATVLPTLLEGAEDATGGEPD